MTSASTSPTGCTTKVSVFVSALKSVSLTISVYSALSLNVSMPHLYMAVRVSIKVVEIGSFSFIPGSIIPSLGLDRGLYVASARGG